MTDFPQDWLTVAGGIFTLLLVFGASYWSGRQDRKRLAQTRPCSVCHGTGRLPMDQKP